MVLDDDFERHLRGVLRQTLDRESGPHPVWAEAPAARRIREARRDRRWPLRLLAVAAILVIGGGATILAGTLDRSQPAPASNINGWIALTQGDSTPAGQADDDIYLVTMAQKPHRIVGTDSDDLDEICPAFSPDGTRLAFGRARKQGSGHGATYRDAALVIAELDSAGGVRPSTVIDVGGTYPPPCATWSPDGNRLAFGAPATSPLNPGTSAEGSEVWIASLGDDRIIKLPNLLATHIEWSPDGAQLAVASGKDTPWPGGALRDGVIQLFSPDASQTTAMPATFGVYSFSWSPDSRWIVHEGSGVRESRSPILILDVTTGLDRALTDPSGTPLVGSHPAWSPRGDRIVFTRQCEGCGEGSEALVAELPDMLDSNGESIAATITAVDSPNLPGTTTEVSAERVTWSPDAAYLLYLGWNVNPNTSAAIAVPVEDGSPPVVLAQNSDISTYDGYDAVAPLPAQSWGRRPDSGATPRSVR